MDKRPNQSVEVVKAALDMVGKVAAAVAGIIMLLRAMLID